MSNGDHKATQRLLSENDYLDTPAAWLDTPGAAYQGGAIYPAGERIANKLDRASRALTAVRFDVARDIGIEAPRGASSLAREVARMLRRDMRAYGYHPARHLAQPPAERDRWSRFLARQAQRGALGPPRNA